MIKITPPSFIATGDNTQTSKKEGVLIVHHKSELATEQILDDKGQPTGKTKSVGQIHSWLFNSEGTNVMGVCKVQSDKDFAGKDILATLTTAYIAELKALNPKIDFEDTLKIA